MVKNKLQVLFALNIILDVLQERINFYNDSALILAYAETGKIQGWLAAHSVTTLYYLITKNKSPDQARVAITGLLQFLKISPVDQEIIEQALILPYQVLEDSVQMISATQIKADYLLTRNTRDFQPGLVALIQPVDLLAVLSR
jgi:predicted nucleic acid-binding protein